MSELSKGQECLQPQAVTRVQDPPQGDGDMADCEGQEACGPQTPTPPGFVGFIQTGEKPDASSAIQVAREQTVGMWRWAPSLAAHSLPAAQGTWCPACPTAGRRQPSLPSPAPSHQPSSAWWLCNCLGTSKPKFFHITPPHSPGEGRPQVGAHRGTANTPSLHPTPPQKYL